MMMAQEMPSTPLLLPVLVILLFCSHKFYAKFAPANCLHGCSA